MSYHQEKKLRFSIRKFKLGIASAVIGISFLGPSSLVVSADELVQEVTSSLLNQSVAENQETIEEVLSSEPDVLSEVVQDDVKSVVNDEEIVAHESLELASQTLAQQFPAVAQNLIVTDARDVSPTEFISNLADLPQGTRYEWIVAPNILQPGQSQRLRFRVYYADGSQQELTARLTIKLTQAQEQVPVAQQKEVIIGEPLEPIQLIVNASSLPSGTKYTWQVQPRLNTIGGKVARVLITYPDGSSEQVLTRVVVSRKPTTIVKEQPTLTVKELIPSEDQLAAFISYDLTDPDNTFIAANIAIYEGAQKVSDLFLTRTDLAGKMLTFPEWHTNYTIKTSLIYKAGTGQQTINLYEQSLDFELKKLEIKDIDSLSLYHHDNGRSSRVLFLSEPPTTVSDYFVRVTSDKFRDMLLPVKAIEPEILESGEVTYRVTTDVAELIEDTDPGAVSAYREQLSFLVSHEPKAGVYTRFSQLIRDMTANPAGQFILGADLFADEVELNEADEAYVMPDFTGTLIGQSNGRQFAIHNLKAPLFKRLSGATIDTLDLKGVAIEKNQYFLGSLAKYSDSNTIITNVAAKGLIAGNSLVGGLVGQSDSSIFSQVSFTGRLTMSSSSTIHVSGGIVAQANNISLTHSRVDAVLGSPTPNNVTRLGGLVGELSGNNHIEKAYVSGKIHAHEDFNGGIIGVVLNTLKDVTSVVDIITGIQVSGGHLIYGYKPDSAIFKQMQTIQGQAIGRHSGEMIWVSREEAQKLLAQMSFTVNLLDSGAERYHRNTIYTSLKKSQPDRAIAYDNIEKLIPFYNKEQIIKYGNLVNKDDKLYQTRLLSVTPMRNQEVISDVHRVKTSLNRLMLHYEDGTVAYLALRYRNDFKNSSISEYEVLGTSLIYTPEQFLSNYSQVTRELLPILQAVNYADYAGLADVEPYVEEDLIKDIRDKLAQRFGAENIYKYIMRDVDELVNRVVHNSSMNSSEAKELVKTLETEVKEFYKTVTGRALQMERLYLEPTFNQIKQSLPTILTNLLATDKAVNTGTGAVSRHVVNHIKQNKEKLLLGLAYMQRWYNIDFETMTTKELATYHQDFYGKPVNTIDWLIELGSRYENLRASNNLLTYRRYVSPHTGHGEVYDYLSANRRAFAQSEDDNTWFKKATKAYIIEQQPQADPSHKVVVYQMLSNQTEGNGLLPLLTAREGIFIIATMGSLSYGMYDRYYDDTDMAGLSRPAKIDKIKEKVRQTAKEHGAHFDVWYRLLADKERQKLMTITPVWDGYRINGQILPKHGSKATVPMLDFFGPVGMRSDADHSRGSGAYADGYYNFIAYVVNKILSSAGSTVFTHEFVHIHDSAAYLKGYGTRGGLGGENYATGLLESERYWSDRLNLNMIFDYSDKRIATDRYSNVSPERFQSKTDLKDYMHGVFDVLYTLDYAEAQVASRRSAKDKQSRYAVIENYFNDGEPLHAGNNIRELTTEEANRLTSWEQFIDHNIIGRGQYNLGQYSRNGYYESYLFTPNYAALSNDKGAPGDLMFRRIAFELLADKGYDEGFVPYASNQLGANASDKTKDRRLKEVGLVTDEMVLRYIYGNTYGTWADVKKAMFRERIAKTSKLKPVTITYQGKRETIRTYQDLERLMTAALTADVNYSTTFNVTSSSPSRVRELKAAIFNAYLRETNDFVTSIYKP